MNWITYNSKTGAFMNLQIPEHIQNDPTAHCNDAEGKKHVAFSDEFLLIDHNGDPVERKLKIDALMKKYGYEK